MSRRPILLLLLLALPAILHAIPPPKKKSKPPPPPPPPATPPPPAPAPAAATPETPAPPAEAASGTQCQWLGLHYLYLVTRSGVRLAINPFPAELSGMPEPRALPADIVLISSEAAELSGGRDLEGLPRIYRSLAGIGQHNANGIPITGIETYRDDNRGKSQGHNTVFVFTIDGMRFCHLGSLGHPLDTKQRRAIGRIDVLFLPLGSPMLDTRQWLDAAAALSARWIVPVAFDVTESPKRNYRLLKDLSFGTLPVQQADASSFTFRAGELPATPTVLLLQHP